MVKSFAKAQDKLLFILILLPILFLASILVANLANPLFGQEEQTPSATTTPEFSKAPIKYAKVDRNKNKIMDHLEGLIGPAAATDRFDVIVMLNESIDQIPTLKTLHGNFEEKYTYPSINGFATNLTKGQVIAFSKDTDVKLVEFDALAFPHLNSAQNWFGTAKARADFSLDGDENGDGAKTYSKDDIVIAILDTGIDPNHVDLGPNKIIAWRDATINNNQSAYDELGDCVGHGSHVSSIAAGEGDGNSAFKGVAPGAALVGIKVLSLRFSQGQIRCTASVSEINSGVQWMIDNKDTYGINIGNMSLGTSGCSDGTDSLSTIVNSAVDAGIAMFTSAGNTGPGPCTIGSPAAATNVVTVGAMADVTPGASASNVCGDNDLPNAGFYLACFSSRGLTADNRIKPDIASPGVFIKAVSALSGNDYKNLTGTSMASPFTAGVAALILDAHPNHTPAQVKSTIESTASDWGPSGKDVDYGAGRLQAYEAIKTAGSFTGIGPEVPSHSFTSDSLGGGNSEDFWNIEVTDSSLPVAITMVMPDWEKFNKPDFDMELRDPNGTVVATSISSTRQETIGIQPAIAGTYQLRVYIFRSNGPYFFDVSFGEAAVAISVADGETAFGILALGETADTTPSGTNDAQAIQIDAGPADLDVKSTTYFDGANTWILSTNNGSDQVKWEFSKDTLSWATFSSAGALFIFDTNVAQGDTRNLYLRLTMPTATSSNNEHAATVTIVASEP